MFESLSKTLQKKLALFCLFYTISGGMGIWNEIAKAMCALEVMSDHPDLVSGEWFQESTDHVHHSNRETSPRSLCSF